MQAGISALVQTREEVKADNLGLFGYSSARAPTLAQGLLIAAGTGPSKAM